MGSANRLRIFIKSGQQITVTATRMGHPDALKAKAYSMRESEGSNAQRLGHSPITKGQEIASVSLQRSVDGKPCSATALATYFEENNVNFNGKKMS